MKTPLSDNDSVAAVNSLSYDSYNRPQPDAVRNVFNQNSLRPIECSAVNHHRQNPGGDQQLFELQVFNVMRPYRKVTVRVCGSCSTMRSFHVFIGMLAVEINVATDADLNGLRR